MSRPGERVRNANGKYVKRKKGDFFLTVHDDDDGAKQKKKTKTRNKVQCLHVLMYLVQCTLYRINAFACHLHHIIT